MKIIVKRDIQDRYDELDNIVSTLDILIDEVEDKDYKEILQNVKYDFDNDFEEVKAEYEKEQEEEYRLQEEEYRRAVI